MNPETNNLTGPIELKAGESAHVVRKQQAVDSARSIINELPNPHDAKPLPEAYPNPPAPAMASVSMATAPVPTEPVDVRPTMVAQREHLSPLETAAPAVPARPTKMTPDNPKVKSSKRGRDSLPSPVRPIMTAIATFSLLLFLFKLPVVISQIKYLTAKPAASLPKAGSVSDVIPPEPTITIPKINVHAPIVYEPSVAEATVQKALEGGIDHYGNTPPPGQSGNAVFFGHSSNDWWEPGNYKFVFVLLDKLVPGDQLSIDYQGHRYVYQVTGSRVVEPTDLSVLAQTPNPTITLITCTPPGTSWKRLVVTANQIQPDPAKSVNAAAPTNQTLTSLPGSPNSIGSQIGQGFSGLWHSVTNLFGGQPETLQSGSLPSSK